MPKNNKKLTANLDLRSEEVQEILSRPPLWIVRWGVTLIFLFTILLVFLSFIIKYPDFVTAKVLVTTKLPTEKVIAKTSSEIATLFLKNQDTIRKGEAIAVLKNTANYKDVYSLKNILDTTGFKVRELIFPIDVTARLRLGEIEPAYIDFEKSYIEYNLLRQLKPYQNQLQGNKISLNEIALQLENQIAQKNILQDEISLKKSEFNRYLKLFEKGVISNQEYEKKQLELLQIQKSINTMAISISQIREAKSNATQNIAETNISESRDNTTLLKNLLQSFNILNRAVADWEYKYVLSSSIDGVVSFQEFWAINQQVTTGDIVFSILPLDIKELVGKLTIPSQNAGKVILKQKVLIKLDNFPYQQYGVLLGKVENISVSPNTEGNYFVYISIPNSTKTSYNKVLPFKQELIGNAEIITEELSVAERIFYKLRSIFNY